MSGNTLDKLFTLTNFGEAHGPAIGFEAKSTGAPIALLIEHTDQRSKDDGNILQSFRPGHAHHADHAYWHQYGIRDPRGGGRSSAHLTIPTRLNAIKSRS